MSYVKLEKISIDSQTCTLFYEYQYDCISDRNKKLIIEIYHLTAH